MVDAYAVRLAYELVLVLLLNLIASAFIVLVVGTDNSFVILAMLSNVAGYLVVLVGAADLVRHVRTLDHERR